MSARSAVGWGLAAGAAGTTALNAATYLDMAVRGRPSSSTPTDTVEAAVGQLPIDVPGQDETRENRVEGIGPLLGLAAGAGAGLATAALRQVGVRLPLPATAALAALIAMTAGNGPMVVLGTTNLRRWDANAWLSDALPHLAFGLTTAAVLHAGGG